MRIAVVGAYGVGMTVKCPRLPVLGETVLGSSFSQGPGGKGSNQAVAAARLGAEAVFLTAVGDDDFGREAKRLWAREGVDGSGVQVVPGQPTMVALILVEPSGDNRIVVAPGALDWLTPKRVRAFADQIAAADIVVVSMEIPLAAALEALRVGREVATPTLLNPAPAEPLPDDAWPLIDIVTPNRSEAAVLMGLAPSDEADPSALALELSRRGAGAAVVTLGRDGAVVAQAGAVAAIPACPVSRVVDTTGAGDAFTGALAVAVAEGMALADAVRFAARAGAHAVTIDEVIPSLATRAELAAAAP